MIRWFETTNRPLLFLCFDITTFVYLIAILDPLSLGPFGAMHLAVLRLIQSACEAIQSVSEVFQFLFEAIRPILPGRLSTSPDAESASSNGSRSPTRSRFWTGVSSSNSDPELGLNVSPPPPYTVSYFLFKSFFFFTYLTFFYLVSSPR